MMISRASTWSLIASVVLIVAAAVYLSMTNPLNLFVDQSSRFEKARFLSVEPGMHIDQVIEALGEPLAVAEIASSESTKREVSYLFMGNPPHWLIAYEKAWVITDDRGIVQARYLYQEP